MDGHHQHQPHQQGNERHQSHDHPSHDHQSHDHQSHDHHNHDNSHGAEGRNEGEVLDEVLSYLYFYQNLKAHDIIRVFFSAYCLLVFLYPLVYVKKS